MPSVAFNTWQMDRSAALDELVAAHRRVGGIGRGRRYATAQINAAYAMLLSSQFQGFCRDLHTESVRHFVNSIQPVAARPALEPLLTSGRKLDNGNPNAGNIGSDFGRLGMRFWDGAIAHPTYEQRHRDHLDILAVWRNAFAHQDFSNPALGGRSTVRLNEVRDWRRSLSALAVLFDELVRQHLHVMTGATPW